MHAFSGIPIRLVLVLLRCVACLPANREWCVAQLFHPDAEKWTLKCCYSMVSDKTVVISARGHAGVLRNLFIFFKYDPENSPEYSLFLYLFGNR